MGKLKFIQVFTIVRIVWPAITSNILTHLSITFAVANLR